MTLLAHKDADGGVQTLRDHLHNAGDLAESYESEFSQIPRMAALLHDVGKVAQQFQTYLISGKGRRGEIPHARQGAFVVNDLPISNSAAEIVKEILELVIAKHHGELPDCINEIGDEAFLTGFTEADKQNPKYAYGEIKQGLHDLDLDLQDTFQQAEKDVFDFAGRTKLLKLSKDSRYFYSGLLVKYVYSRLIDADRTDTAYFEAKEQYHPIKADWSELIRRLDESMKSFDSTSEINKIRQQITEQCRQAGSRETGIYRLSVPTGGGKTLASLNFALHHALETGKRRIIYVIPYLSITSQTVATFRNMLGLDADSNIVLEHYSTAGLQNSGNTGSIGTSEEEDAKERQRKLASERWDNPIIVTTMVEFLETVMSARGTKLRKFHNMANSVIIFDEIQSLPLNIINPFNEVVSFLSTILDSTILLCSATQPLLERTARKNLRLSDEPDLIDNTDGYEEKLKRTRIIASQESKSCEELANIIYEQALRNGNCLSIVNTKSEARKMYQCLQELNADGQFELIHLSTAMCGKHRADQLARIKVLTDPHDSKPVICVSTQLIEAGVDLSFACVVRAMAGLDSIMQAAGRCNRNGESKEIKDVYVYPLQGEERFKDYLPEIHRGKKLTLQIMGEHPDADLLSTGMLNEFYGMLLQSEDRDGGNSLLDGPLWKKENAGKTIYELLAYNESQRKQFENNTMGERYNPFFAQAFKTVGNEYRVIPKITHNVVVPYGNAMELLDMLGHGELREKIAILRRLQEYTVSLFDYEYKILNEKHAISIASEDFDICVLNVAYEGAPPFADIISCAYDVSDRSSKAYKRFAKNTKKQLIECMFGGESLPRFILDATYHRVTKPMGYDAPGAWLRDFEIACSLWKKHYIDDARKQNKQEDTISMYLEPTRNDRDYLYGRLLALADRFENGVLYKQGISDTRPTNAVKLMSNFVAKPFTTWGTLWKQLMPYLKSANGAPWFQNSVDEVMALFKEGDFEDNRALSPLFLLGYSCQRRESMHKAQEASQKSKEN